jgi:hypothetical protein
VLMIVQLPSDSAIECHDLCHDAQPRGSSVNLVDTADAPVTGLA